MGDDGGPTGAMRKASDWRAYFAKGGDYQPRADQILPEDPATPPDLTDDLVQRARIAAIRRAQMGGQMATFLTGPIGDPTAPPTAKPGGT